MKRLHPSLHMPLALALASLFSLGLFLLTAQPQLQLREKEYKNLLADFSARRTSLTLQQYQPVLDRLQRPILEEKQIIRLLRECTDSKFMAGIRFSFGTLRDTSLGNLPAVMKPLTLTITGMPLPALQEMLQEFLTKLPNHAQLATIAYEKNGEKPALSSARLEFEIYGATP